ncbi:MAG: hypothetical protein LBU60_01245 [Clostridiales bacterium]|jgi:F-type H+-transporting ATPase subunit epsilon|nr:hypothetical protein [Clostridiales bacterium]
MAQSFLLQITTPNSVFFDDQVLGVIVNSTHGNIGVLANIVPIIAVLKEGTFRIRVKGKWMEAKNGNGFLKVRNNVVTILCQSCAWAYENMESSQETSEEEELKQKIQSIKEHHNTRSKLVRQISKMKIKDDEK